MSWIDNIQNIPYKIITGDKREWSPKFLAPNKEIEYNHSEYNFINLPQTFIDRKLPKSARYSLTFYFEGDNNIDIANAFEISASNVNAWTIEHPFYGNLIVQPLGLKRSNEELNVSKFECTVVETLDETNPKKSELAFDKIQNLSEQLDINNDISYAARIGTPEPSHSRYLRQLNEISGKIFEKIANTSETLSQVKTGIGAVTSAIDNIIASPVLVMRQANALATLPASFFQSVDIKFEALEENYRRLKDNTISNRQDKLYLEGSLSNLIKSMCLSSVYNGSDGYIKRSDVIRVIDKLRNYYTDYLIKLDSISDSNAFNPNSYIPSFDALFSLYSLVNVTIINLFDIAFNSKQEREIYLSDDTNVIILAHQYYSIATDENIDFVIRTNDITLNELFQLKKGRKFIYYV